MKAPHILLIPGLGDRSWLYSPLIPIWSLLGYRVSIHQFGWSGRAEELKSRQDGLRRLVDRLPTTHLYVIGASAGGVAAINLLSERPTIRRVVAIASPLTPMRRPPNELLAASLEQADAFLAQSDPSDKEKIVSVHGLFDARVPVELSRRADVHTVQLPTIGHSMTISLTLTAFSRKLLSWL